MRQAHAIAPKRRNAWFQGSGWRWSRGFPGCHDGSDASDIIFDSKLGTVTPLGSRAVTLTSPKGKYDIKVEVNALGQARSCVPATQADHRGDSDC